MFLFYYISSINAHLTVSYLPPVIRFQIYLIDKTVENNPVDILAYGDRVTTSFDDRKSCLQGSNFFHGRENIQDMAKCHIFVSIIFCKIAQK